MQLSINNQNKIILNLVFNIIFTFIVPNYFLLHILQNFSENILKMQNLGWYISLYYKFREYPVNQINSKHKHNQLRTIYANMLKKMFTIFQIDHREYELDAIINKNNYELLLNKKTENALAQETIIHKDQHPHTQRISHNDCNSQENLISPQLKHSVSQNYKVPKELVQSVKERNMEVFYELMIKMIRISLRRLSIETFAIDKYGKNINREAVNEIFKDEAQFQVLKQKLSVKQDLAQKQGTTIYVNLFPQSIEEMKYQFLKYSINSKIYNNPQIKDVENVSLQSQNSLSSSQSSYKQPTCSLSYKKTNSNDKQTIENNIKKPINDNQVEEMILKVSEDETTLYNKLMTIYYNELRINSHQVEIIGFKEIAQSMFELSSGKPIASKTTMSIGLQNNNYRKYLFDDACELDEGAHILSNTNLMLATWFDLILFNQKSSTLYDLVEQMVKTQKPCSYLQEQVKSNKTEPRQFYDKISSYFHLLILNTTKNIFIESLCKINYQLIVAIDIVALNQNSRKFKYEDIQVTSYEQKQKDGSKKIFRNILICKEKKTKKKIWKQQAIQILLNKWKVIGNVLTDVSMRNKNTFFPFIFQKCSALLAKQLTLQMDVIEIVIQIADKIFNNPLLNDCDDKLTGKSHQTQQLLYSIIRQIIGFSGDEDKQNEHEKQLNINNIFNQRLQQNKYKESTFANQQQNTEELQKWNQIVNQNIFLYQKYKQILQIICSIFKNNYLYIGIWFVKFHEEVKILIKRVDQPKLQLIFKKFKQQIPLLWESLTCDNISKSKNPRRPQKSKFRNRISSIKLQKNLNLIQKKAIVLNYMLKAQLQLYSQYMLIHYLTSQKRNIQSIEKERKIANLPTIFKNQMIQKLLLFSLQDSDSTDKQSIHQLDHTSSPRKHQRQLTSNFAVRRTSRLEQPQRQRTLKNLQKQKHLVSQEMQQLIKAIDHFQNPMNIQLDLKQHWKQKYGQKQIQFLGQLSEHIRYINEINYSYEFWRWLQNSNKNHNSIKQSLLQNNKKIELLTTNEYQIDLFQIESNFNDLQKNEDFLKQLTSSQKENKYYLQKQKIDEMMHQLKAHNKQLYMIIQAIIEGQNYYKLIASNLIGREKYYEFRKMLQEFITVYKNKKSNSQYDSIKESSTRKLSKKMSTMSKNLQRSNSTKRQKNDQSPLLLAEHLVSKVQKKSQNSFLTQFEFAPQYYKLKSKIFRLDCLVSSFYLSNNIFKNIKNNTLLSKERYTKLTIIGGKYYDKIENIMIQDQPTPNKDINQISYINSKNKYEIKLLLFLISLINLIYNPLQNKKKYSNEKRYYCENKAVQIINIPSEDQQNYQATVQKYSSLIKKYLYWCIHQNTKKMQLRQNFEFQNQKSSDNKQFHHQQQFNIYKLLTEILELNQKIEQFSQEKLLFQLQKIVQQEQNLKFKVQFKRQYENQKLNINIFNDNECVEYLRKKFSYYLMREIYFILNYDNQFLNEKSINSKNNYAIYENRIIKFYDEIIELNYQDFIDKRQQEMKKRSIHLLNYQFKYEDQPKIHPIEQKINKLICCLYNQLLTIFTQEQKMHMHKKNKNNYNPKKANHQDLYHYYCSKEYLKQTKENSVKKYVPEKKSKKQIRKQSISSIFANLFLGQKFQTQKQQNLSNEQPVNQQSNHFKRIRVYTNQNFIFSQAIYFYKRLLNDYQISISSKADCKLIGSQSLLLAIKNEPLTQMELSIIKVNQNSLITLLKSQFLQKIHEAKCRLIRKNLISNIQKLYINLDVRHKVFQSFKDKILSYEMQKAKIYHQYMDYIRGLKLDVYSHMAGQDPFPYIKIVNAVKIYRLSIKKVELQKKVNQQFQKNLKKWNSGIQKNIISYDLWLNEEQDKWRKQQITLDDRKKELMEIYSVIFKQMNRQSRKANKNFKKMKATQQSITYPFEKSNLQIAPVIITKRNQNQQLEILKKQSIQSIKQKKFTSYRHNPSSDFIKFEAKQNYLESRIKCAPTETTKNHTKYDSHSINTKSGYGFRGLSIKYDTRHIQFVNQNKDFKKKQRQTINQTSKFKSANNTLHNSHLKRHFSAQKFNKRSAFQRQN